MNLDRARHHEYVSRGGIKPQLATKRPIVKYDAHSTDHQWYAYLMFMHQGPDRKELLATVPVQFNREECDSVRDLVYKRQAEHTLSQLGATLRLVKFDRSAIRSVPRAA